MNGDRLDIAGRLSTGEKIAEFDHELLRNDTRFPFVVQTEQHKLVMMGMDALRCMPNAAVRQNAAVRSAVRCVWWSDDVDAKLVSRFRRFDAPS